MDMRFDVRKMSFRALLCSVFMLTVTVPSPVMAQSSPPSPQKVGMQLSSRASLMEAAGQVDQALSMYQKSWTAHPRDSVIHSILDLAGKHSPRGTCLSFLTSHRGSLTDEATRKRVDGYLSSVTPSYSQSHGKLTIYVFPSHARVVVTTPRHSHRIQSGDSIWTEPGALEIQAVARNHEPLGRNIHVTAGSNDGILLALNPRGQSGVISITSQPTNAEIQVDGVPIGRAPIQNLRVKAGSHVVTAHLGNRPVSRQMVRVRDNGSASVDLSIAELPKVTQHDFKRAVYAAANRDVRPRSKTTIGKHPDDREYASGMAGIMIDPTTIDGNADSGTSWLVPTGWLTLAGGLATAGVGAYYTYAGLMDVDAANNLNRQDYKDSNGNLDEGAFDAAFARYEDRSKVLFQRSFILYGGGAALVTTGLLMVLLAPDGADEPSFSFAPVPGGATLQTMTRF